MRLKILTYIFFESCLFYKRGKIHQNLGAQNIIDMTIITAKMHHIIFHNNFNTELKES